jgi:hypothetical protein
MPGRYSGRSLLRRHSAFSYTVLKYASISIDPIDDVFLSPISFSGSNVRLLQGLGYQLSDIPPRIPKRTRDDVEDEFDADSHRYTMSSQASQRPRYEGGLSSPPETPAKKRNGNEENNSRKIQIDWVCNWSMSNLTWNWPLSQHNSFHERAASLKKHLQSRTANFIQPNETHSWVDLNVD